MCSWHLSRGRTRQVLLSAACAIAHVARCALNETQQPSPTSESSGEEMKRVDVDVLILGGESSSSL